MQITIQNTYTICKFRCLCVHAAVQAFWSPFFHQGTSGISLHYLCFWTSSICCSGLDSIAHNPSVSVHYPLRNYPLRVGSSWRRLATWITGNTPITVPDLWFTLSRCESSKVPRASPLAPDRGQNVWFHLVYPSFSAIWTGNPVSDGAWCDL